MVNNLEVYHRETVEGYSFVQSQQTSVRQKVSLLSTLCQSCLFHRQKSVGLTIKLLPIVLFSFFASAIFIFI